MPHTAPVCASSVNLEPRAVYSAKPRAQGAAEQVDRNLLQFLPCETVTASDVKYLTATRVAVELLGSLYVYVQYTCITVRHA